MTSDGLPAHGVHVYMSPDPLPPEAVELFGDEVVDAWQADPELPQPMCVGATTDGLWLAGIFMVLETLEVDGPNAETERVASIRQLIVQPAYRGRGLAGRLLRRAMATAVDAGCTRVRSTAGFGCPDHAAMYHRLKFQRAAATERPYLVTRPL